MEEDVGLDPAPEEAPERDDSAHGSSACASPRQGAQQAQRGHAKRLNEYVQYRKQQERKALMRKVAFNSEEYSTPGLWPGSGAWMKIGEQRAAQNPKYREIMNGRRKREVTTPLGVAVNVPPTLCIGSESDAVFLHTDASGMLCRTDFATARHFKQLQRRDMAIEDERKLRIIDPPSTARSWSSLAPAQGTHDGIGRFASPFPWQPAADDPFPWYKFSVGDATQILGLAIRSPLKGKSYRSVASFSLTQSSDGVQWQAVDMGMHMGCAMENGGKVERVMLQVPLSTEYLRIHPKTPGVLTVALIIPETRPMQRINYPTAVVKRPLADGNTSHTQVLYPHSIQHHLEMDSLESTVLQEYVRPRGAVLTQYRCVYKAHRDSYGFVLSHKHSLARSEHHDANTRFLISQDSNREVAVMPLRPHACGEMIEKTKALIPLVAPLVRQHGDLDMLVTDWIRDKDNKWWLLQIKAWRIRPHLSAFYGLTAPVNTEVPFGAESPAPPELAEGATAARAARRARERQLEPQHVFRMCGMCRERGDHPTTVTVKMLRLAVEALKIKGEWAHEHTLPADDGNKAYQTVYICDTCYALYKQQKASFREEQDLAKAIGHVLSTAMASTSAINPKMISQQQLLIPQRVGERHNGDIGSIIQSASLGKRYELRHHELPRQWQFMLYFESIHQLPLKYLPDPVAAASQPHYTPPNLSLRITDLLGAQDIIPLRLHASTEPSNIALKVLKIRAFYTGPHEDTAGAVQGGRLHEKVATFLHRQKQVSVSLCKDDEPLGVARFPLLQLVSGMTPMLELTRIFSSVSLGTCSLRLRVGIVQSHLRYTKEEYPILHSQSGLYVPCCPSYTISALPREWKKVVSEGVRLKTVANGGGKGAVAPPQLSIEGQLEGEDPTGDAATAGDEKRSSNAEAFDMWATAATQASGKNRRRAGGRPSVSTAAAGSVQPTPRQRPAKSSMPVRSKITKRGSHQSVATKALAKTYQCDTPGQDSRAGSVTGSDVDGKLHDKGQQQVATRGGWPAPRFNSMPYFLDAAGGRTVGAPVKVPDHAARFCEDAAGEAPKEAPPSRQSMKTLVKEKKQAAVMLESLTAKERLTKYQAWAERYCDATLRKERNKRTLQQKKSRRARAAKTAAAKAAGGAASRPRAAPDVAAASGEWFAGSRDAADSPHASPPASPEVSPAQAAVDMSSSGVLSPGTKSALAKKAAVPSPAAGESTAPKPLKKLQFADKPVTMINPDDPAAQGAAKSTWDLGTLRKKGGAGRSFMAWKIEVNIRAIQGDFATVPHSSYLAKYSLFGKDFACEGFGVTDAVPVSFENEDTTYLFCLNNKSVLKYFKDIGQRVRVSIGSPYGEFNETHHATLDFGTITDAIANKKHPPVLDVLYPLRKTQRMLVSEGGDNLIVENASELSDDDDDSYAGNGVVYREKQDNESSDGGTSSSGSADGDSDLTQDPMLECVLAATPIDLDISAVTIVRDLRPNYDIAIVSLAV
eukprot:TRINITY_DN11690_c1_g3_i1.p1 TRINITY_DN11690_c1_g3~~TRINITY_DN11690_c1_g3_i1.p1  ORF type:complete len:1489 (+),score=542.56 TRINITY_DN11690_c1_g3_i1:43-4509(+)